MNEPKNKLTEEELKLIEEEELFLKEVYSDPEVATAEPPAEEPDHRDRQQTMRRRRNSRAAYPRWRDCSGRCLRP